MIVKTCAMFVLLVLSGMTIADEIEEDTKELESELVDKLTPEQLEQLRDFLERENKAFVTPPNKTVPREDRSDYSGEWIEKEGARECDGYITRIESEDFCGSEAPADWEPFEFNGKTYFVQPLANDGR